jgi:protein TonB
MFEQAILADPPKARKTRALVASFLAQIAICGVLLLVPLVYTDAITVFPDYEAALLPPSAPPPPPPEQKAQPRAQRSAPRVFVPNAALTAPVAIPKDVPIINDAAAPPVNDSFVGIPGAIPTQPGTSLIGIAGAPPPPEPTPEPVVVAKAPEPTVPKSVRISGGVQAAKLIQAVKPTYPSLARTTRVHGTVRMQAVIGRDGRVRDLQVVEGHPLLRQAAVDAVRQWVYSPTILGDQPVEVETSIEVNFVLN